MHERRNVHPLQLKQSSGVFGRRTKNGNPATEICPKRQTNKVLRCILNKIDYAGCCCCCCCSSFSPLTLVEINIDECVRPLATYVAHTSKVDWIESTQLFFRLCMFLSASAGSVCNAKKTLAWNVSRLSVSDVKKSIGAALHGSSKEAVTCHRDSWDKWQKSLLLAFPFLKEWFWGF